MEAAPTTAPSYPASQDHPTRRVSLSTPQSLRVQNDPPPPPPVDLHSRPVTYPRGCLPASTAASTGDLPVHPRQAEKAYKAVFQALIALLPSCPAGEVLSGGGCRAGAGSGIGKMQAAALRCGVQCQGHIRALQNGIQVRAVSERRFCRTTSA